MPPTTSRPSPFRPQRSLSPSTPRLISQPTVNLSNSTITTNTAVTWQVNGGRGQYHDRHDRTFHNRRQRWRLHGTWCRSHDKQRPSDHHRNHHASSSSRPPPQPATITSNSATVTVGRGAGLAMTPTQDHSSGRRNFPVRGVAEQRRIYRRYVDRQPQGTA